MAANLNFLNQFLLKHNQFITILYYIEISNWQSSFCTMTLVLVSNTHVISTIQLSDVQTDNISTYIQLTRDSPLQCHLCGFCMVLIKD